MGFNCLVFCTAIITIVITTDRPVMASVILAFLNVLAGALRARAMYQCRDKDVVVSGSSVTDTRGGRYRPGAAVCETRHHSS